MADDKDPTTVVASSFSELGIDLNAPAAPVNYHRLWVGGCIAGATVLGTLALIAPFVFTRSSLPYMATPGRKIRQALEFVKKTSETSSSSKKKMDRFVDLGSGDGEGVYQAVLTGYKSAIGIELNRTLFKLSRIRRQFFWSADLRQRSSFLKQDFFSYDLSNADTCMIFGVTPLMEPISRKLAKECVPGSHVLAYRFKLPLSTEKDPHLLQASIVYDVEEMRVYKCH